MNITRRRTRQLTGQLSDLSFEELLLVIGYCCDELFKMRSVRTSDLHRIENLFNIIQSRETN